MAGGWLKLYRELIDKPIWKLSTPEQKAILVTLLCMANHEEKEWLWEGKKYTCKPGQFITSLKSIADNSGTSIQNVRTTLKNLEQIYEFLTSKSTNKNRLVTITNWELYQSIDIEPTSKPTSDQQAANKQLTTNKKYKNYKKYKKKDIYTLSQREIFDYWNSKEISKHEETITMQKAIEAALKKYGRDKIIQAIDHYVEIYKSDYFYSHLWHLDKFLKQRNGVPEFLDTGQVWQNYLQEKGKPKKQTKTSQKGNFEQRNYDDSFYDGLYDNAKRTDTS